MWLILLLLILIVNILQTPVTGAFQNGGSSVNIDKHDNVNKGKGNFPKSSICPQSVNLCPGVPLSFLNVIDSSGCPCSPSPGSGLIGNCPEFEVKTGNLIALNDGCYFQYGNQYFAPQDFCLNSWTEARICKEKTIIRKCCNVTETYNSAKWKCQGGQDSYYPKVSRNVTSNNSSEYPDPDQTSLSFWIQPLSESIPLGKKSMRSETSKNMFYLTQDGVYHEPAGIFLRGLRKKFMGEYCLERNEDESVDDDILMLYDSSDELQTQNMATAMGILWLFSVPFCLVTALAHVFVLQRNIHGFALAGYLINTSVQNIFAALLVFNFSSETVENSCSSTDFIQKILYCSNVCWMTIINFDLWISFRKLNVVPDGSSFIKFPFYALFALVFPSCVVFVDWIVGRELGQRKFCVLYETPSLIIFSAPILILIIVNATFFIRTSLNIRGHCQSTENILKSSDCISRKSFTIFAKLFLMTGSFWIIRMILLFFHFTSTYLTLGAVILEAVFISPEIIFFFLVFSSRATWKKFRAKFPILETYCCCSGEICPPKHPESNSSSEASSTQLSGRAHKFQSSISVESIASQESIESYI
ncbi:unnamed protein product [Allacma fusca]|uniref:Methuselah N-terminal domain-containing protein n=1 Tax=Allacma fusca TaxID=39272 RepID=A0A8J2IZE8_9HEXA|nr:unnamed protein product [Allacma fusca]